MYARYEVKWNCYYNYNLVYQPLVPSCDFTHTLTLDTHPLCVTLMAISPTCDSVGLNPTTVTTLNPTNLKTIDLA